MHQKIGVIIDAGNGLLSLVGVEDRPDSVSVHLKEDHSIHLYVWYVYHDSLVRIEHYLA